VIAAGGQQPASNQIRFIFYFYRPPREDPTLESRTFQIQVAESAMIQQGVHSSLIGECDPDLEAIPP
jgi:hypothetical protein